MIDDKTIKSLYDDKPTLLEWLKRVEAQLEELKKVTDFDKLTANNVEVKEDVNANNLEAKNAVKTNTLTAEDATIKRVTGDFNVNGNPICRNIYIHQITWNYVGANVTKKFLSTKPTPYSSMADIFSHKNDTSLSTSEVVEYGETSAIVKFSSTGVVLSAVAIGVVEGDEDTFAMNAGGFDFVKDEVIGDWGV